ncbi:hypothetical protein D3X26_08730 [Acinetobacter baumannii]|nr:MULTISPECIES: hypothetical protein [Acinetobacter calcoaceticus/baumannii complex]AYX88016.1 hypothetical protein EGX84_16480 [Acinetobacter baumannii]EKT7957964.1 hypothetical protein [Acinetobacter baumannii]EKU0426487.1 hypothetical protein [Acinetobacter baumannii]EKV4645972.1 hypothetical protein [Acinetobacter baumannii]EKV6477407.1 hypothetical protein [Acinetobacter baumannii]
MDNIIQFPKSTLSNRQEIESILIQGLVEHGANQEDVGYVVERMSNFLDILCEFEFSSNLPKNPRHEDIQLLFEQLSNKLSIFRDELLLERFNAESFYLKGD